MVVDDDRVEDSEVEKEKVGANLPRTLDPGVGHGVLVLS